MILKATACLTIGVLGSLLAANEAAAGAVAATDGRTIFMDIIAATPIGASLIAVVYLFLRHIETRDKQMSHSLDRFADSVDRLESTIRTKK